MDTTIDNSNYKGALQIFVNSSVGTLPIEQALVKITVTNMPDSILFELTTDSSGHTPITYLPTPNLNYSLEPSEVRPYGEYDLQITATGYQPLVIEKVQILADEMALQHVTLTPNELTEPTPEIIIPNHTLYGTYPPKIPEDEIKKIPESGEIVLSRVVVPEYIIVHDGVPTNNSAKNYYVKYKDYIKAVASAEVYATWPESTLYANILAIQSFTLNRVYTEWYRNKGYDFTITSSTAFDQKWSYGQTIFSNIDYLVDTIFANYLSRPGVKQPIFTSYCDGNRVNCTGLSQWGSKYLGDEGYSAIEIIRYYYGNDMFINTADAISGVPSSWPGYTLTIGSSGEKVRQMQTQLNRIARNYPLIPTVNVDGIYGQQTANAVKVFQKIFNLPATGNVDYTTWYKISEIYVGVSRISEPD
ncbi:MAG: peptidoglycan-binding protein [Lachnospiraceae bacterium]